MGRKLLVADDSVTIQKVIKLALSSEGYDILAVSEGKEAIRAIQEERPDVVLIDVTLPGADAYAVKRAINSNPKLAATAFLLMLSAFERVDEDSIAEVGFQGRLIKPFDPSHLRKAVAELMAGAPPKPAAALPPSTAGLSLTPPPPPASAPGGGDFDLPPVTDALSVVAEEPLEKVTEEEFNVESPAEVTRTMTVSVPTPEFTRPISIESLKAQADAEAAAKEEKTDPNFALPPEAKPPAFTPPAAVEGDAEANRSLENDIRDLTESTIKMSGLDEWNLDDAKKMKGDAPAAPPAAPPKAPPAPTFTLPPAAAAPPAQAPAPTPMPSVPKPAAVSAAMHEKRAAIMRGLLTPPSKEIDDGNSSFQLGGQQSAARPGQPPKAAPAAPPKAPPPAPPPAEQAETHFTTMSPYAQFDDAQSQVQIQAPPKAAAAASAPSGASGINRAELEQIVRKDLEAIIEKLAREAVPRIAEALIRKEIEKILSEP